MTEEVFTYLIGGKAGEGVKKAGTTAARLFLRMGRNTFEMDDYQSLIRGGHNFSVVSSSMDEVNSHYMKADLVVNLDERSYEKHKDHVSGRGVVVNNSDEVGGGDIAVPLSSMAKEYSRPDLIMGVAGIAVLCSAIGMDKEEMKEFVAKEYSRGAEENIAFAEEVYDGLDDELKSKFKLEKSDEKRSMLTGNEALALGACAAGLDIYFAYPMTPASSILHFLADHKDELKVAVVHPENEIAVANMAIGSTVVGARAMVGSSGGGFALMEEAFSLAGMAESPVLFVLSSRPGPSTGVPTYTEQADLDMALNQGQGDFPRVVASPCSVNEAFHLTAEMLNLLWKFQTPGILLTEKHLSESGMVVDIDVRDTEYEPPLMHEDGGYMRYKLTESGVSPMKFPPSDDLIRWNSYESREDGVTTEDAELITKMHDKRERKQRALLKELKDMNTVNVFGDSGPVVMTYGSTTSSVLEALSAGEIDATVVQPKYLKPLPIWELEKYNDERPIIVEQSVSGQFATLLRDKIGLRPSAVIKRYDGRPFEPEKLAEKLKEVL
ncbi:MAG: 2-oxoacid:acceptor oxidoreductase subunit alpha [Thermoplasmata archaeon]